MADKDDKLIIEIELDDGKLAKGFVNAESVAQKQGRKAGKKFGQGAYKAAINPLNNLKSTILGLGVALGAAFAVRSVVDAAKVQERAVNDFNTALKLSGQFSKIASEGFQEYASSLQANSTVGDEVILQNAALIQNLGKLKDDALRPATKAALDMSAALGIDLRSAATLVGKAAAGEVSSFTRYGVVIEKGATSTETFSNALKALAKQFGGAAAAKVNTFEGAYAQLTNTFGDLQEEFGKFITESPLVISAFKVISARLSDVIKTVSAVRTNDFSFKEITKSAVIFGRSLINGVVQPLELIYNSGQFVFSALKTGFQAIYTGAFKLFGALADVSSYFGVNSGLVTAVQDMRDTSSQVLDEMVTDSNEKMSKIFDFSVSDSTNNLVSEISTISSSLDRAVSGMSENVKNKFSETHNTVKKTVEGMSGIVKNGFARVIAGSTEVMIQSLIKGEDAFKNLGNFLLGVMGDLLIQVGTAIITTGAAIEALQKSIVTVIGAPAIAAGIALVALGAALKTFSSEASSTGSSASASVSAQTGGESFGSLSSDSALSAQPETRDNSQQVVVNIQGDYLETEDTAFRVVKMINQAIDQNNISLRST